MEIFLKLRSSLLIGGYTSSLFFDISTARDGKKLPFIPGSTIKGALRVAFERLFPDQRCASPNPQNMCKGPDYCLACRIFGNPRFEGKLRFGNATLQGEALEIYQSNPSLGYEGRPGVSISRKLRTAKEGRLFIEEVLRLLPNQLTFAFQIEGFESLDEEEREKFLQLLEFLKMFGLTLGGRKTVGYGHFEVNYSLPGEQALSPTTLSPAEVYIISLEPEEPFRVSPVKAREYHLPSSRFIPASTVKGAFAIAARRRKLLTEDEFKALFLSSSTFFSPLYPSKARLLAFPIPLSARTCKAGGGFRGEARREREERHGVKDILIETFIISKLWEKGIFLPRENKCELCSSELVPLEGEGYYIEDEMRRMSVLTRFSTKLAVNRKTLTSEEGMLYSYELIDPSYEKELRFVGIITSENKDIISKLALLKEVYIGGGRSRGMGRMKVELAEYFPSSPLTERMEKFREALQRKAKEILGDIGLGKDFLKELDKRFYFSLTLLSELVLPPGKSISQLISERIGREVKLEVTFTKVGFLGGFNLCTQMRKSLVNAIAKGSCFIFSAEEMPAQELEALEKDGLGLERFAGCGWVRICHPFHYQLLEQS